MVAGFWGTKPGAPLVKARVFAHFARTNPDHSQGHRGFVYVPGGKPSSDGHSFEHTQPEGQDIWQGDRTIGYRGMHSFVCFDSVFCTR